MHLVPGAGELLCASETGRSGADDRHLLAGLPFSRLWPNPAVLPGVVDDGVLDRLDRHRVAVDVERAGRFAWRRADASGELGKVVRRVQDVERCFPLLPIDEVVPVGNDVVDRAPVVAEGDATVHAARSL